MKKMAAYSKGGPTKKLAKAKNGRIVKNKVVDPEGNVIKTKENMKTGRKVTKVIYADPVSSGMKREKTVTPGLSRFERKANEMYAKNPKAAKEDSFTPFSGGSKKKGGMVKKMMKSTKKK